MRVLAFEWTVTGVIDAFFIDRRKHWQAQFLAQLKVFLTASRRNMDDSSSLRRRDFRPRDHAVTFLRFRANRKLIKRPIVGAADQFFTWDLRQHFVSALLFQDVQAVSAEVIDIAMLAEARELQPAIDRARDGAGARL